MSAKLGMTHNAVKFVPCLFTKFKKKKEKKNFDFVPGFEKSHRNQALSQVTKAGAMGMTPNPSNEVTLSSPRPKKHLVRSCESNQCFLFFFFSVCRIVPWEFVPPGENINHQFFLDFLRGIKAIKKKCVRETH